MNQNENDQAAETQAVVVRRRGEVVPAMTVQDAATRYNQIVQFCTTVLKKGVDYGPAFGGSKDCLLKPGAEKLCTFFGLRPDMERVAVVEDFQAPLFHYAYRCTLRDSAGELVASAEGSCNSHESKYRYRTVGERYATPAEKAAAVKTVQKRGGNGGTYNALVIPNPDVADQVNTIAKMAQKRALIAAVLVAVGVSELFSQDLEVIDAEDIPEDNGPRPSRVEQTRERIRAQAEADPPHEEPPAPTIEEWQNELMMVAEERGYDRARLIEVVTLQAKKNGVALPGDPVGPWHDWLLNSVRNGAFEHIINRPKPTPKAPVVPGAAASGASKATRSAPAEEAVEKGIRYQPVKLDDLF